jgi:transcriptional regulator with XRE-family HTH domain
MAQDITEQTIKEVFARRLRDARRTSGFTQEQLADAIRMSVDMVGRLERGAAKPSFETLAKLSAKLSVSPAYFFGCQDDETNQRLSPLHGKIVDQVRGLDRADLDRLEAAIKLIFD